VRSRGAGGATDEFIELWNPTASPVTLDATWRIYGKGSAATLYITHWTGSGKVIPAYGHYLVAGTGYTEAPSADDALSISITDAASLRLQENKSDVDVACYAYSAATQTTLSDPTQYTCSGTPADNSPHNDTTAGNVDQSILRKAGPGSPGNSCTDTNMNAADFAKLQPSTPRDAASAPTP
jgi:hypothetical protein